MKALIDTCVILDALQNREPFADSARSLFLSVANHRFAGCITAKALTDIYYLMHRHTHDDKASRYVLGQLASLFEIADTAGSDCLNAITSSTSDYEDAVMIETASRIGADFIVTRNTKDYEKSPVPVRSPEAFLKLLDAEAADG